MFDPAEFFYLARELHFNPLEPLNATARSSISRAYYSAFLVARENAEINNSSGSVHTDVHEYYKKKDVTLANRLKDLKVLRQLADYDLKKSISKRETGKALRLANDILETLGKTISERPEATDGILSTTA